MVPPLQDPAVPFGGSVTRTKVGMTYGPNNLLGVCFGQNPDWTDAASLVAPAPAGCAGMGLAATAYYDTEDTNWEAKYILQ